MLQLPRIAVGNVQSGAGCEAIVWALRNVLQRSGLTVQPYMSQARLVPVGLSSMHSGQSYRHLDSWLMAPEVCREVLINGTRFCDLALVEGPYDAARHCRSDGGSLDVLCDWLDLPRLMIVDVSKLDPGHLPLLPSQADGLLLDCVENPHAACKWRTVVEAVWGVPVVGAMDSIPALRTIIRGLPPGASPSAELCRALGGELFRYVDLPKILQLASQRPFPLVEPQLYPPEPPRSDLSVSVAYDEAFNCYFPDTLDALEARGATVRVFSPLRGDSLPPETDLVYIGCGNAEHYARELAANHCMHHALLHHVAQGKRIYAECTGMAYLCRQMIVGNDVYPMTGVLPAVAKRAVDGRCCQPVEVEVKRESWLCDANTRLRGYLNTHWDFVVAAAMAGGREILLHQSVVGSRLHLDFVAQPSLLERFFRPPASSRLSPVA